MDFVNLDIPSDYLIFEDNPILGKGKKTKVVLVISKRQDHVLGEIRWYGPWRQYTFRAKSGTIWNTQCLEDVQTCIRALMDERKK